MTERLKLPPVSHATVDGKLKRLDELTIMEARGVIIRLCDQLLDAEQEIADLKNERGRKGVGHGH
jgi:hypothetical protein